MPYGFLIPPWYSGPKTSQEEIVLADIVLGFFLCCMCFAFAKAVSQTATRWNRLKKFTAYLVMVWIDWAATVIHSVIGWCVGHGTCSMQPSFWLFLAVVVVWTIEMHCLSQILVNRVSLLLFDPMRARRLKIAVFVIIFVLTTSVTIIWIPAEMEISRTWERLNSVWDRGEKVAFLIFDVAINSYFVHLVRSSLIANGLSKYRPLYRFNLIIITVSILLDVSNSRQEARRHQKANCLLFTRLPSLVRRGFPTIGSTSSSAPSRKWLSSTSRCAMPSSLAA